MTKEQMIDKLRNDLPIFYGDMDPAEMFVEMAISLGLLHPFPSETEDNRRERIERLVAMDRVSIKSKLG